MRESDQPIGNLYILISELGLVAVTGFADRKGPWKNIDEVEYATLEWVDWFNNRRLLEPIGNIPPAEYELMYYQQLEESSEAA